MDTVTSSTIADKVTYGWFPVVFTRPVFQYSLVFYIIISVLSRQVVRCIVRGDNEEEAEEGGFASQHRKRDTIGRWVPSLVHATIAAVTATLAALSFADGIYDNEDVILHSLGYFLGDLIVDRDPDYILHHVGPIITAECIIRSGGVFWHTMRAGLIMEWGNVFAHTAALLTYRKGPLFHKINTWSFYISRPLSYYDGFMAWYVDVPPAGRWTLLGVIPLIGILGVYYSNTKWMIQMCRPRPPKVKTPKSAKGTPFGFANGGYAPKPIANDDTNEIATNGATSHANGNGDAHTTNGHTNHTNDHMSNGHTNGDANGHIKSS